MSMIKTESETATCAPCERKLWKGQHGSHSCSTGGCACPVCHSSAKELLEVLDAIDDVIALIPGPRPAA